MHETSTILVCDHRGAGILKALRPLAAAGFRIECSQSLKHSLERLNRARPTLMVVDMLSPEGFHELGALDRAREEPQLVPMLVVRDSEHSAAWQRAVRALHAPAWDLVDREASAEEFRLRIDRLLAESRLRHEVDDLRHRASHDDRTDLLRPQAFQSRLSEQFSAAQRHGLALTLALIDLDNFGSVNKIHDHTVGDQLISEVGSVVRQSLRTEDIAGRLGGDEFAVLLPFTSPSDASGVVRRLLTQIERLSGQISGRSGAPLSVTGSLGYATFDGSNVPTADELRRRAEQALRAAKTGGGNRAIAWIEVPQTGAVDEGVAARSV
ncbi:diguanylate cyclase [Engelhardtia mirabilis]|uniref:diguanylate cyclase n=1 Tax=Engelhardtia mirabilis TaxID=2528011 RepID=A0A518BM63_9BACT|nr:putative diguanylate cyclase YcdT [Planctomycetes bacterium Pla133]QDV02401.1 putative diguanylate cyclase YcdT [Planctomycetes bacterium Pla86]